MKILCISDQIDPLVYSPAIGERFQGVDLVLSAGDLPREYLEFVASSLQKPLLFVLGNHHREVFAAAAGAGEKGSVVHAGGRVLRAGGLIVAGLGRGRGKTSRRRGKSRGPEMEIYFTLLKLLPPLLWNRVFRGRFLDILLTHTAPDLSAHRGALGWFMRVFKPRFLVHGQIHLYDLSIPRIFRYRDTLVVNAYSHYLLDTDGALKD